MKSAKTNSFKRFIRLLYLKLVRIHDSPQRIALGLGLGVFTGILPGTGPIAALFLAFALRVNRASALLGNLLTNAWISLVTLILAIKVGSFIFKLRWEEVEKGWIANLTEFNWRGLCKLSILTAILPVIIGYLVIAFCIGLVVYWIALTIIISVKHK